MDNLFQWLGSPVSAYNSPQSGPFTAQILSPDNTVRNYPVNYYPGVPVRMLRYNRTIANPYSTITQNGRARQV